MRLTRCNGCWQTGHTIRTCWMLGGSPPPPPKSEPEPKDEPSHVNCVFCRFIRRRAQPRYDAPLIVVGFIEAIRPGAPYMAFREWIDFAVAFMGEAA